MFFVFCGIIFNMKGKISVLATIALGVVLAGGFCSAGAVDRQAAACDEIRADAFGFDPADSTCALRKAIQSGARRVVIPRMEGPWYVTPLSFAGLNDVEIVFEDGAEVCAKRGAFKGKGDRLLAFQYCRGLTLRGGGRLRMWKGDYPDQGGHRHALAIHCCRDVRIEGLEIVESGGDGIYLSTGKPCGAFKAYSEDVVIRNVRCLRNFRQGISVIAADGLLVEGCELSDTCGTSPQAGIDFEPNNPGDAIRRCVMRNCTLERNRGFGIDTLFTYHDETTPPLDITIERCVSRDNEKAIHFNGIAQNGNFRSNAGRIVVTNCVFREKGGRDETVSREVAWGGALSRPDGAGLRPFTADDWREDAAVVTDLRPGACVDLSPVRFRYAAEYVIYAAAPGEIAFEGRQVPVGAKGVPSRTPLTLARFRGGKVAEIPAPATTNGPLRATVPAKGFYRLSWACGWGTSLVLVKSSVPIAFSMFPRRDGLGRWLAPFLYGCDPATLHFAVPEGTARFAAVACGFGGGAGASARMVLSDPTGRVAADIDNVRSSDAYVSAERPSAGLWTLVATRPSARPLNNFGVDVAGIPPLFFLSKEKYWMSR